MKNIGKPCAGKPHARFDEGGQARACSLLYIVKMLVTGLVMALLAGAFLKLKLFGGGQ